MRVKLNHSLVLRPPCPILQYVSPCTLQRSSSSLAMYVGHYICVHYRGRVPSLQCGVHCVYIAEVESKSCNMCLSAHYRGRAPTLQCGTLHPRTLRGREQINANNLLHNAYDYNITIIRCI